MTRFYRAALTAAFLAAAAAPALAQNAPMGAPSDTAPPAPLQTATDAVPARDAAVARTVHAHRMHHHRVAARKAAAAKAAVPLQTGS